MPMIRTGPVTVPGRVGSQDLIEPRIARSSGKERIRYPKITQITQIFQ
jgi:hypothetical protein